MGMWSSLFDDERYSLGQFCFFRHLGVSGSRIRHCACRTWTHAIVSWSTSSSLSPLVSPFDLLRFETRSVRREVYCIERKVKFLTFLFVDWLQQERNAWRASRALVRIEKDYSVQPTDGERERTRTRILIRTKLSVISFSLFAWVCHRLIQCRRPHTHTHIGEERVEQSLKWESNRKFIPYFLLIEQSRGNTKKIPTILTRGWCKQVLNLNDFDDIATSDTSRTADETQCADHSSKTFIRTSTSSTWTGRC